MDVSALGRAHDRRRYDMAASKRAQLMPPGNLED